MIFALKIPDSFQQIIPSLGGWIDSLATDEVAVALQGVFAQIEVVHILGLFALSACVGLTSLRLIGVGLTEAPASGIYRSTRWWLTIGVILAIGSGLLMGLSNASKLYNNSAFLWKMIAMIAAIVFSYLVMAPTAKADGKVGIGTKIGLIVGLLIWLVAFIVMLDKKGANVGLFHVMFAAVLLTAVGFVGRMKWVLLGGVAVLVLVLQVFTHVVYKDPFTDVYTNVNKVFMWVTAIYIFGLSALNIVGLDAAKDSTRLSRLVGYATILAWVTVGAGGRWIGLT